MTRADDEPEVYLSPATIWEVTIKQASLTLVTRDTNIHKHGVAVLAA